MKLYTKNTNLVGQTIGFPDLGDVTIDEKLELEVTDEQYENIEWGSLGWFSKEEIDSLDILPQLGVKDSKEAHLKTKSQEIEELKGVVVKLIDENTSLKAKDEQNTKDFEEATSALETLNAENETLLAQNEALKAEIAKLVEENTLLRKAPETPVVSEAKAKK